MDDPPRPALQWEDAPRQVDVVAVREWQEIGVAIYINVGYDGEPSEVPARHISGNCARLLEIAARGFPDKYHDNSEALRRRTRRCEQCFVELPAIPDAPRVPRFIDAVKAAVRDAGPTASFVYNVHEDGGPNAQIGKANDPAARLRKRWRASLAGGYLDEGIPWLNTRLQIDPTYEPVVTISAHPTSEAAVAAENALRDRLRTEGWLVSSKR